MEYLRIENDFPRISHSAVTLGKFDGIHRGHQKLVEKIIEQKQEGAQAVVLALGTASRTILTKEERCRILEEMGVDITTSRGLGTAVDFALSLISQLENDEKAKEIAESVVYTR